LQWNRMLLPANVNEIIELSNGKLLRKNNYFCTLFYFVQLQLTRKK